MFENKKLLYDITIWRLPCCNLRSGNLNQIPETKSQIDAGITPSVNNKWRLSKSNVQDVNHIISSYHQMSARYYLPLRHDVIASNIMKMMIKKNHQERNAKLLNEPEYVIKIDNHEYWWNMSIKTATKPLISNQICLYEILIKKYVRLQNLVVLVMLI